MYQLEFVCRQAQMPSILLRKPSQAVLGDDVDDDEDEEDVEEVNNLDDGDNGSTSPSTTRKRTLSSSASGSIACPGCYPDKSALCFAYLELESSVYIMRDSLLIASKLDFDTHSPNCRIAFFGKVLVSNPKSLAEVMAAEGTNNVNGSTSANKVKLDNASQKNAAANKATSGKNSNKNNPANKASTEDSNQIQHLNLDQIVNLIKMREKTGFLQKLADRSGSDRCSYVVAGMFSAETDLTLFQGLEVVHENTGVSGIIEGGYTEDGRIRVRFEQALDVESGAEDSAEGGNADDSTTADADNNMSTRKPGSYCVTLDDKTGLVLAGSGEEGDAVIGASAGSSVGNVDGGEKAGDGKSKKKKVNAKNQAAQNQAAQVKKPGAVNANADEEGGYTGEKVLLHFKKIENATGRNRIGQ
jgi:hypothetical protein